MTREVQAGGSQNFWDVAVMTKEEIKDRYSMKDILDRYGLHQPNRAGFICCPFHKEKTASMKIYQKDFNCFGCGANGDIFTFVMLMDGISFKEAFSELGGDYENSFSTRLKIYQAQKKREMQRKVTERLKRKRELNCLLMDVYRKVFDRLEPFSEAWTDTYNALQYQEYLWEILRDPDECYMVIKRSGQPEENHGSDQTE